MEPPPGDGADPRERHGERRAAGGGPLPSLLAVVNASTAGKDADALGAAVRAWRVRGHEVEVAVTDGDDELAAALRGLDGRRLVVVGGDGSVNAVVGALRAAGALAGCGPVGLVPLGTGNDLAQSLGLPVGDVGAAAAVAGGAGTAPMELLVRTRAPGGDGTGDGGGDGQPAVAVNAVHVGIGVEASQRASALKPRLGALGYPVGAVAAGVSAPARRLRVVLDGEVVHDGGEPLAMVALTVGRTIGGGAPIAPDASPHDGLVEVVLAASASLPARAGYALDVLRGGHGERGDVRRLTGRSVRVETADGQPFAMDVDGDLTGEVTGAGWEVVHGAWTAVVPPR